MCVSTKQKISDVLMDQEAAISTVLKSFMFSCQRQRNDLLKLKLYLKKNKSRTVLRSKDDEPKSDLELASRIGLKNKNVLHCTRSVEQRTPALADVLNDQNIFLSKALKIFKPSLKKQLKSIVVSLEGERHE